MEEARSILYVACGNGRRSTLGGSLMRSLAIARELRTRNWHVEFLATSGTQAALRHEGLDCRVHPVPDHLFKAREDGLRDRAAAYATTLATYRAVIRTLGDYQIVYSDSDYPVDILPAAAVQARGSRWVAMVHHRIRRTRRNLRDRLVSGISHGVQTRSFRRIARRAAGAFVYDSEAGDANREELVTMGMPRTAIHAVTNGVPIAFLAQIPSGEIEWDGCFIGGLRPSKGLYDLIPIWQEVVRQAGRRRLVVIGSALTEYRDHLLEAARSAGLAELIHFKGALPHGEAIQHLKRSRVCFFPSREEGWGIAVCEAMACEIPVVAWDLPVYRRPFGALIQVRPVGDVDGFARSVTEILTEGVDPELLAAAREAAARYDWSRVAAREAALFEEILARPRS